MDDFRVGSVPSAEPYADRHPYGATGRKRHKHNQDQSGEQEEPEDVFEAASGKEEASTASDNPVEDYFLPSAPAEGEE